MTDAPAAEKGPGDAVAEGPPIDRPATVEACPLCGAPLDPRQDWCLNCGAAARTRLAATPSWRGPIAAVAAVAVLALGVLAAALVKLAGGSDSGAPATTRTVTTAPAASVPTASAPTSTVAPGAGATTATGTTTPPTAPTVTAQPEKAGGIASPGSAPTVTARSTTTPKALRGLPPSERRAVEKILKPGTKANSGR